jgi:nicotinamidase-related amidase
MTGDALIVLDLQRDFLEERGRMRIAAGQVEPLIGVANATIDAAQARGTRVAYVVNAFPRSQRLLNFFRRGAAVAGTMGAELDPRVRVVAGAPTFTKDRGDGFTNPELGAWLKGQGVKRLAILGVFAPACVRATARGALRSGFEVTVVGDGVGAGSDGARARALRSMARDGVTIGSSADWR